MKLIDLFETHFSDDNFDDLDFGSDDLIRLAPRISDKTLRKTISENVEIHFVNFLSRYWVLTVDREPVAFLQLGYLFEVADSYYMTVELIYAAAKIRKSVLLGKFFLELKSLLSHPLIIGAGDWGGVTYKHGTMLIKKLAKSHRFKLQSLDLKTGELSDFDVDSDMVSAKGKTIVFK